MPAVTLLLTLFCLALAVPVLVLLAETLAALFLPGPSPAKKGAGPGDPGCVVLIPAHDEEKVIGGTLSSLKAALSPRDEVLVVADNCRDETASIAAAHGAKVVERKDEARRGKGFALDFGLHVLAEDPPEMVVILDADCFVDSSFLVEIKESLKRWRRPVQGLYLMKSPSQAGPLGKIAEFAWFFKSFIRQQGLNNMGLPCHLQGSVMGFLWEHLESAELAGSELVEDMKLGLELAEKGTPACFNPHAIVRSTFPAGKRGLKSQRTRWEHGHLGLINRVFPSLFLRSILSDNLRVTAFSLDLAVPPLALLALLLSTGASLGAVLALAGRPLPFFLGGSSILILGGTISLAWLNWGRGILSFRELLSVPWYMAGKVGLYLRFLWNRETDWVRTRRD